MERFQKKHGPTEIVEKIVPNGKTAIAVCAELFSLSKSEARRLIEQGGIRFDGSVLKDPMMIVHIPSEGIVVNKGKLHYVRIKGQ